MSANRWTAGIMDAAAAKAVEAGRAAGLTPEQLDGIIETNEAAKAEFGKSTVESIRGGLKVGKNALGAVVVGTLTGGPLGGFAGFTASLGNQALAKTAADTAPHDLPAPLTTSASPSSSSAMGAAPTAAHPFIAWLAAGARRVFGGTR